MELNNFGFNKNECIHCPTEELAIQVLKISHDKGYKWNNGASYLDIIYWGRYRENMCYHLNCGTASNIINVLNYTIIPAEDFLKQHNNMINNHKPYLVWN